MIEFNLKSRAALECARTYITYLLSYLEKFREFLPRYDGTMR